MQILLDRGADVIAQGEPYHKSEIHNALQAASAGGHEKMVQMLKGRRREYDNTLSVAS